MDPYPILILCWFSGAFLSGFWRHQTTERSSGFYSIRSPQSHSQLSLRYLPILTGIPNRVPLFREGDGWRYRVPGGPWVYPSMLDIINRGQTENGDPLVEE